MARGKKAAKELSPEEKLQQVFVPVEEQPYPIPENWCWTRFDSVVDGFQYGYTEKATYDKVGPHFIRITDIGDGIIDDRSAPYCKIDADTYPKYKIHKNDIFIARMGSVGENGIALEDIDAVFASYLIRVIPKISATLVIDYLQSPMYWGQITDKSQGTTRLNVNANLLKKLLFPLPPLSEQHRIVSRIESLFVKLDEAKEKAQAVVDGFELRKSAILHKAFTGELTERWRKEHGVGLESWINTIFKSILDVRDGTHDSPEYVDVGYALVTSKNLKDGKITDKNLKYISQDDYNKINARSKVDIGDILFAMIGTIGNPVVIKDKPNYAIKNVALFKNIKKVNPYFVKYYLETKEVRDKMDKDAKGSTQRFVSLEYLRNFPIPIPTEAEQIELVERVDNLLEKGQQAKEAAEAVLIQIDTMKKAILARAFRGELGTNNPKEEWAGTLLNKLS